MDSGKGDNVMNVIKYKRNFLLTLFMLAFGVGFSFAQSNYEKATQYYIAGDYHNAAEYFKKTILEDKKYDGTIFYRLGYSMEQSKLGVSAIDQSKIWHLHGRNLFVVFTIFSGDISICLCRS